MPSVISTQINANLQCLLQILISFVMEQDLRFSDIPAHVNLGKPVDISWSGSNGLPVNLTICRPRNDISAVSAGYIPFKILDGRESSYV